MLEEKGGGISEADCVDAFQINLGKWLNWLFPQKWLNAIQKLLSYITVLKS